MGKMHGRTMQPTNVFQPNSLANRFAPRRQIYLGLRLILLIILATSLDTNLVLILLLHKTLVARSVRSSQRGQISTVPCICRPYSVVDVPSRNLSSLISPSDPDILHDSLFVGDAFGRIWAQRHLPITYCQITGWQSQMVVNLPFPLPLGRYSSPDAL
jgi:hypothetical protein